MNRSAKELIKILEEKGFVFKRAKGSHLIYHNPVSNKTVIVPFYGNKDLPKGSAILKQAMIDNI